MVSSSSLQDELSALSFVCLLGFFGLFCFWNRFANLSISRSFYINLQLHSTCKFATRYPLWSLGIITMFCNPQTHFAHHRLPVFLCMTTAKLPAVPAAACAPPVVTLCLPPPPPLLKVSVTTPGLDFSALHHYMSHETAVPPHKEQQKKSKFAAGTWSNRKNCCLRQKQIR